MSVDILRPACRCIEDGAADLRATHNAAIATTVLGGCALVRTEKVDAARRGKPAALLARFCPFCGVGYRREPLGETVVDERGVVA